MSKGTSGGKLGVGATLSRIFLTYRDHAGNLLWVAAMTFLPLTLITEIVSEQDLVAGMVVSLVLSGPAAFVYAAVVAPIAGLGAPGPADGNRSPAGADPAGPAELWGKATPLLGRLILAGLLYALATSLGVMLLILPGIFLVTIWAVAPAVLRLEHAGAVASLGRSRELVRGHGWQVLTLILCMVLLILAGTIILQTLAIAIAGQQTGTFIGSWLGVVIAAPPLGLLPTVLYEQLQGRRQDATADDVEVPTRG